VKRVPSQNSKIYFCHLKQTNKRGVNATQRQQLYLNSEKKEILIFSFSPSFLVISKIRTSRKIYSNKKKIKKKE
jgi:hypothetical protein